VHEVTDPASPAPLPRMRPQPKDAGVSERMSRMPRASTKLELTLRRALHARGLRFRIQRRDLPGTPDLVFSRARIAVFVDGCFWHSCPDHGTLPKNNREWWQQKLAKNVERDARKDDDLRALGWTPLHFWEHTPVDHMADDIVELWCRRTGRS
jgi:DNA mismatch endonuclease (patch repair protein)